MHSRVYVDDPLEATVSEVALFKTHVDEVCNSKRIQLSGRVLMNAKWSRGGFLFVCQNHLLK